VSQRFPIASFTLLPSSTYFTAFASFGTPFILYTIGWILLLGKAGPVNYWLKTLLDQTGPVINVYSLPGMIFIEALLWSPFVFLMLAAAFRSMDPSLEEAARIAGASRLAALWRILLPMTLPGIAVAFLLVFIPALSELSATILLYSGGTETIAVAIFRLNDLGQIEVVAALAVFTITVTLLVSLPLNWLSNRGRTVPTGAVSKS